MSEQRALSITHRCIYTHLHTNTRYRRPLSPIPPSHHTQQNHTRYNVIIGHRHRFTISALFTPCSTTTSTPSPPPINNCQLPGNQPWWARANHLYTLPMYWHSCWIARERLQRPYLVRACSYHTLAHMHTRLHEDLSRQRKWK